MTPAGAWAKQSSEIITGERDSPEPWKNVGERHGKAPSPLFISLRLHGFDEKENTLSTSTFQRK